MDYLEEQGHDTLNEALLLSSSNVPSSFVSLRGGRHLYGRQLPNAAAYTKTVEMYKQHLEKEKYVSLFYVGMNCPF